MEKAVDQEQTSLEPSDASRWRRIIQRVENESISLGDHYPQFKEDLAELRRDFRFKHDEPD